MNDTRERLLQALSDAGAVCGDCDAEPGDRSCPQCERCRGWYADAAEKTYGAELDDQRKAKQTAAGAGGGARPTPSPQAAPQEPQ